MRSAIRAVRRWLDRQSSRAVDAYVASLAGLLAEWDSPEDDAAYRNL